MEEIQLYSQEGKISGQNGKKLAVELNVIAPCLVYLSCL
jgi:hypothetical protein